MANKVGEYLKHDPLKLRFTQSNGANGSPKNIIRRMASLSVAELIQPSYMTNTNNLLYYELLDVSIIELETKKSLKITWVGLSNKEEVSLYSFYSSIAEIDVSMRLGITAFVLAAEEYDDARGRFGSSSQARQAVGRRIESNSDLRNSARSSSESVHG